MWFITGIVVTLIILGLAFWLKSKNKFLTWYEWLIGSIGLALLLYALQNFRASFLEHESGAAWFFWLFMGGPALILLAIDWQLFRRRNTRTIKAA